MFLVRLTVFLIVVAVIVGIVYGAVWVYRRPTVKREQLETLTKERNRYKEGCADYWRSLRDIHKQVHEVGGSDSPLALQIDLILDRYKDDLDNPMLYQPERNKKK